MTHYLLLVVTSGWPRDLVVRHDEVKQDVRVVQVALEETLQQASLNPKPIRVQQGRQFGVLKQTSFTEPSRRSTYFCVPHTQ